MEMAIGGGGGDLFGSWTGAVPLTGEPLTGGPWTGAVPWTSVPLTGVPLAGVPLTGVPLNGAVPLTDGSRQAELYH